MKPNFQETHLRELRTLVHDDSTVDDTEITKARCRITVTIQNKGQQILPSFSLDMKTDLARSMTDQFPTKILKDERMQCLIQDSCVEYLTYHKSKLQQSVAACKVDENWVDVPGEISPGGSALCADLCARDLPQQLRWNACDQVVIVCALTKIKVTKETWQWASEPRGIPSREAKLPTLQSNALLLQRIAHIIRDDRTKASCSPVGLVDHSTTHCICSVNVLS